MKPSRASVVIAGHRGDHDVVDHALTALDGLVRAAALGALARQDRLTTARLVTALADDDGRVRRRAADEAARLAASEAGPDDLAGLVDALVTALDDHADVAERAAFALGECAGAASSAEPALSRAALGHDDALVREACVAALGAIGVGRATILAALADKATVRRRAVIALAPFDDPEVDDALRRALDDRDWQVRQAAEDLLGPDQEAVSDAPDGA